MRPTDRLFFAVLPDAETGEAICSARRHLCEKAGLQGTEVPPEQLHVTLWRVGDYVVPPTAEDIDAIVRQASTVEMPPFRLSFGSAKSHSRGALVLCGGRGSADLENLSTRLRDALTSPGAERRRAFLPHMTLMRSETILPERRIKAIGWTVREIVLVHSQLGRAKHRAVGRLPLRGRQLPLPGFDF
ncbi:2'-5' RNA ligase family protein [Reyranella sp.]|uniref:2'-5' RNA ligase family protein n=1 Tax=Reyranella sp. TaxID=1929291 RepID=UPI003D109D2A